MATITTRSSSSSSTSPSRDNTSSRCPSWSSPTPSPSKPRRVAVVEIKTRRRSQTRSAEEKSPLLITPSKGKENARPSRQAAQAIQEDLEGDMEGTASPTSDSFDPATSLPTPKSTPTKFHAPIASTSTLPAPRIIPNIFAHAHTLLSTSNTSSSFVGRTKERAALVTFLSARFPDVYAASESENALDSLTRASKSKTPARPSLYVSGPPGIGKTALLSHVLSEFVEKVEASEMEGDVKVLMESCSSVGSAGQAASFWERLAVGLEMSVGGKLKGKVAFERGLKSGPKFLIVLDEIDHILTLSRSSSSHSLLNSLFLLAHSPSSTLTLIGIANALTLTTTHLDLSSAPSNTFKGPQLIHFQPYDSLALVDIVQQRLALLASAYPFSTSSSPDEPTLLDENTTPLPLPLIEKSALQLCAKRIQAATGDVRIILDVVRKSISILERSTSSTLPPSSPTLDPLSHLTPTTAPKVSMKGMGDALRLAGLSLPRLLTNSLAELNFNARNVLVSIVVAIRRLPPSPSSSVNQNAAFQIFTEVLRREGTLQSTPSKMEFTGAIEVLESSGFVSRALKSPAGKKAKLCSPSSVANPLLSLSPTHKLADLLEALQTTPSNSCERAQTGAMQETLRISKAVLREEERRRKPVLVKGRDEMAPKEGFNGDGLEEGKKWIGGKRPRGEGM